MTPNDLHFEELWERCENLQREASAQAEMPAILDELMMKLTLYRSLDGKMTEIPEEERQKVKSRTLGEILLVITCLSYKENVNVFEALNTALYHRTLQHLDQKYPLKGHT